MELEKKQGLKILVVFDLDHTLIDVDSEYMWGMNRPDFIGE